MVASTVLEEERRAWRESDAAWESLKTLTYLRRRLPLPQYIPDHKEDCSQLGLKDGAMRQQRIRSSVDSSVPLQIRYPDPVWEFMCGLSVYIIS